MTSAFLYAIYISAVLALVYGTKNKKHGNVFLALPFLVSVAYYFIRFDVGPDYHNYCLAFYEYASGGKIEFSSDYILWGILSKIFSWTDRGYLFVFGIFGLVTQAFLFHTLKQRGVLFGGLFLFYTLGFFFHSLDAIRQMVAVTMFVYSIRHVENRSFSSFFRMNIMSFLLFHHSVVFPLLLYPLYNSTWLSKHYIAVPLFLSLLILQHLQVFNLIWESLYVLGGVMYGKYEGSSYLFAGSFNTGLGHSFLSVIAFCSVLITPQRYHVMRNMVFMGLVLHMIAAGNLNMERVALYFLMVMCVLLPDILKKKTLMIRVVVAILCLIYWSANVQRAYFDFKTIFSDDFAIQHFEPRDY